METLSIKGRKIFKKEPLGESMSDKSKDLLRNSVSFIELVFQSISFTAPAIAVTATMTGAASFAYGSLPLTYILAIVAVFSAAYPIYMFSRRVASSGGYYRYIERGLGQRMGAFGGWVYILYTVVGATPFIYFETALAVQVGLGVLGIQLPDWSWFPIGLIVALGAFALAYSGIRNSLRYSVFTGTIEMLLLLALGVLILSRVPHPLNASVFTPKYSPTGWQGVALGLVFSFTSLAGWGSMTFLGAEAKQAHANMRRGVIVTIAVLGAFFLFMSYAFTIGWGPTNMATYFNYFLPGLNLALEYGGVVFTIVIFLFVVNSGLVDTLAIINAGSRDLYTMAKDKLLPEWLSYTHPRNKSPHHALIANTLVGIALFTIMGWIAGPFNGFIITGTMSGVATLLDHLLVNTSLPFYMRKLKQYKLQYALIPAIASAIYLFAIYGSFLSINTYVIAAVISVVAFLLFGAVYYSRKRGEIKLEAGEEL
jgi:Amino acid transporters